MIKLRTYSNPVYEYMRQPKQRTKLYYGIELETGVPCDCKMGVNWFISQLPDWCWPKHDGSILDNANIREDIEIVSHPATYKWIMAHKDEWNAILNLRKKGLLSYDTHTCGMHVHMSRNAFTRQHLNRFKGFIYDNADFSKLISGRRRSQMHWCSLEHYESYWGKTSAVCDRPRTIEVRLFRGTLNPISFWKNLEFLELLYKLTKTNQPTLKHFLGRVDNKYPNLQAWLNGHKDKVEEIIHACV